MNTYQHSIYGDDYYFSPSGALMRGRINVLGDGSVYYHSDKDGALKEKGWIETKLYDAKALNHSSSMWYYAKKDGILAQGWCQIDGKWYFFGNQSSNSSGEYIWGYDLKTDIILTYKGKNYYLDKDGVLQTGLYYRRNIEYFMPCYSEPDGSIVSGWKTIDGKNIMCLKTEALSLVFTVLMDITISSVIKEI